MGCERFPVDIQQVTLDYSRRYCPSSPIDRIHGEALEGLDGLLTSNGARTKWLIVYNTDVPWPGRIRFTIAHEFGHYLLHRQWQTKFICGEAAAESGVDALRQMEQEADQFASGPFTFERLDRFIRRRLRAVLRKQSKRPGHGRCRADHQRWPNAFFAAAGLFALYPAWQTERNSR